MPEIKDTQGSGLLCSPAEVRRLVEQGAPVTAVDARGRAAYTHSDERVAGDLRASGKDLSELISRIDPEDCLFAYCTCLGDGLAIRVAARLREAGFARAFAIEDGLEGCRAAGLAIVSK